MNNSKTSVISLVLSVIALLVSVVLIIVSFSSKKSPEVYITEDGTEILLNDETVSGLTNGNSDIAFIDTEKLLMEYKYSIKLNEDLLTEQSKARASFESKYRQFEKKYNSFMEKARLGSFLSQASMESQQNELIQEQSQLEQMEADLTQKLMEKQAALNNELLDTLTNFLKDYNKDKRYSMIISNALVLYGENEMDITEDVVLKLNERYEKNTGEK
ncbi:MAG: OmpH family outer membrane protein [Bacteroidales bacterium]|jgi:outer membrane protein|nr:OmpH family outer membrane protein [Bacteroidales bacterium]